MKISVTWHAPLRLPLPMTRLHERIDLELIPDEPAIYMFARRFDSKNCRPGQRSDVVLEIVERALIDHFTEKGDQLINKLGTKLPVDVIEFDGNRLARQRSGRELRVPKRRGRGGDIE